MRNFIFIFFIFIYFPIFSCTTMFIGKKATTDGSVIVAHCDDDELGDQRIIFVPSKNYKKNAKRRVYPDTPYYPRYSGKDKGPNYFVKGLARTKPGGYIPQVTHTYAFIDGNYAIVNEKQLAIGECTDDSKFSFKRSKKRIFQVNELSRIALERCTKAKDAVKLIGSLAEKYGYCDWGETIIIADKEEGWVFEISSSPDGESAIWVAKKVPDDEVFVAANEFKIRYITPFDKDILHSTNLFKIAEERKWYNPKKEKGFDWLKSVSNGEYNHPYYSLRRVWRLQTKINPTLKLKAWVKNGYTKEYPFSIKPLKKLSVYDVMNLFRDQYRKTEFDLTKGVAAGPFGNPNRYEGPYDNKTNIPDDKKLEGAWERPIAMYYCGFTYITQLRSWLPDIIGGVTWVGLDCPENTCFVPFYCGVNNLPLSYQTGNPSTFSHDTAWWAFNFVGNWASLKYSYMLKDIKSMQEEIEKEELLMQKKVEQKALKLYKKNPILAKNFLTKYCIKNANLVVRKWWQLAYFLIEKYTDGYISKPKIEQEVGYPKWWRDKVGYKKGPRSYKK